MDSCGIRPGNIMGLFKGKWKICKTIVHHPQRCATQQRKHTLHKLNVVHYYVWPARAMLVGLCYPDQVYIYHES